MFYTRRTIFNRLHTRVCVCVCRVWYRRPSLVSQAAVMSQLESKNQGLVTSMSKSEGGGHHFSSVLLGVHVGPHTSSPSAWPPPKNAISCTHTHTQKKDHSRRAQNCSTANQCSVQEQQTSFGVTKSNEIIIESHLATCFGRFPTVIFSKMTVVQTNYE